MTAMLRAALLTLALVAGLSGQPLQGVVDIHGHCAPDVIPRSVDAIEATRLAQSAGLRALGLKNHYEPTVTAACRARRAVSGVVVVGGIALNRSVGVEHCILSSDMGQAANPLPPDGMARFPRGIAAPGFSERVRLASAAGERQRGARLGTGFDAFVAALRTRPGISCLDPVSGAVAPELAMRLEPSGRHCIT